VLPLAKALTCAFAAATTAVDEETKAYGTVVAEQRNPTRAAVGTPQATAQTTAAAAAATAAANAAPARVLSQLAPLRLLDLRGCARLTGAAWAMVAARCPHLAELALPVPSPTPPAAQPLPLPSPPKLAAWPLPLLTAAPAAALLVEATPTLPPPASTPTTAAPPPLSQLPTQPQQEMAHPSSGEPSPAASSPLWHAVTTDLSAAPPSANLSTSDRTNGHQPNNELPSSRPHHPLPRSRAPPPLPSLSYIALGTAPRRGPLHEAAPLSPSLHSLLSRGRPPVRCLTLEDFHADDEGWGRGAGSGACASCVLDDATLLAAFAPELAEAMASLAARSLSETARRRRPAPGDEAVRSAGAVGLSPPPSPAPDASKSHTSNTPNTRLQATAETLSSLTTHSSKPPSPGSPPPPQQRQPAALSPAPTVHLSGARSSRASASPTASNAQPRVGAVGLHFSDGAGPLAIEADSSMFLACEFPLPAECLDDIGEAGTQPPLISRPVQTVSGSTSSVAATATCVAAASVAIAAGKATDSADVPRNGKTHPLVVPQPSSSSPPSPPSAAPSSPVATWPHQARLASALSTPTAAAPFPAPSSADITRGASPLPTRYAPVLPPPPPLSPPTTLLALAGQVATGAATNANPRAPIVVAPPASPKPPQRPPTPPLVLPQWLPPSLRPAPAAAGGAAGDVAVSPPSSFVSMTDILRLAVAPRLEPAGRSLVHWLFKHHPPLGEPAPRSTSGADTSRATAVVSSGHMLTLPPALIAALALTPLPHTATASSLSCGEAPGPLGSNGGFTAEQFDSAWPCCWVLVRRLLNARPPPPPREWLYLAGLSDRQYTRPRSLHSQQGPQSPRRQQHPCASSSTGRVSPQLHRRSDAPEAVEPPGGTELTSSLTSPGAGWARHLPRPPPTPETPRCETCMRSPPVALPCYPVLERLDLVRCGRLTATPLGRWAGTELDEGGVVLEARPDGCALPGLHDVSCTGAAAEGGRGCQMK